VRAARSTRALLLLKLAASQVTMGDWAQALHNTELSRALAAELQLPALESEASTLAAFVAAARGDGDACRMHLAEAHRRAGPEPAGRQSAVVQWLLGMRALSQGHVAEAHDRLRPLQSSEDSCPRDFAVRRLSAADFVMAAVQSGAWDDAERCTSDFGAWLVEGSAPWAELDFARCRALLAGDDAEEWFVKALALLDRVDTLPVSARVELDYGGWLRRRKRYRDARAHLRLAVEYFESLGAWPWRGRARSELRAAGEADRHDVDALVALTPQELRIARLAAEGNSNREIASALILSPRTVGYHLHKVFPKLGVSSRAQLARALNDLSC
jgi:DNA-binding CsgD family transcriptional regulator